MLNGDGLRSVLWVAGCSHGCKNCHNPITWDICGGIPFDEAAKEELLVSLEPDYISGITFSGGDPLHMQNRDEVGALIEEVREKYRNDQLSKSNKMLKNMTQDQYQELEKLNSDVIDTLILAFDTKANEYNPWYFLFFTIYSNSYNGVLLNRKSFIPLIK